MVNYCIPYPESDIPLSGHRRQVHPQVGTREKLDFYIAG